VVFGGSPSPYEYECPPKVLSSEHEARIMCAFMGLIIVYNSSDSSFQCHTNHANKKVICEGIIDKATKVPTCSQAVIPSCERIDLHATLELGDIGNGPCYWCGGEIFNTVFRDCAHCDPGEGVFSCFDDSLGEWCQGTVLGGPRPTVSPTVVDEVPPAHHNLLLSAEHDIIWTFLKVVAALCMVGGIVMARISKRSREEIRGGRDVHSGFLLERRYHI